MVNIRRLYAPWAGPLEGSTAVQTDADIMVKGRWHRFPAIPVEDRVIAITGRWLRKAVVHGEARQESALRDPVAVVELLRRQRGRLRADIFTFAQQLPRTDIEYAYPLAWDSVAVIWIKDYASWWNSLPPSTRKNIRRSEKGGVVVHVRLFDDDLVKGIASINNASPIRQGRTNYHYGKSVEDVRRESGSYLDRSIFICAFADGEMIAFLKLVYQGQTASILNLAVRPLHSREDRAETHAASRDNRHRGVARILIAKAVELCAARGVSCLRYGLFNYGNKQVSSLKEFKTLNGFVEVRVPRYYVPLTRWGALCIRLNLHRGLLAVVPPRVIAQMVSLRARWHTTKLLLRPNHGQCSDDTPAELT